MTAATSAGWLHLVPEAPSTSTPHPARRARPSSPWWTLAPRRRARRAMTVRQEATERMLILAFPASMVSPEDARRLALTCDSADVLADRLAAHLEGVNRCLLER